MAGLDPGQAAAQFEFVRMQFVNGLGHVAQQMRDCAAFADQLAGTVSGMPYNPAGMPLMQFPVGAPGLAVAPATGGKRKTRDGVEGKKTRKKKDPLAPKRPPSSYLLFQNEVRSELKRTNPGLPNNELLGMIAKQWSEMSQEDKEKYENLQKAAKDRYLEEKDAYQAGSSPVTGVVPTAAPVTAAKVVAVPAPVVAATPTSDDSSEEEEENSSEDESLVSEEPAPPPSKRSKKDEPPAKVAATPKKQKKQLRA